MWISTVDILVLLGKVYDETKYWNQIYICTLHYVTLSILSMSACFGKNFWNRLPVFTRSFSSLDSWKNYLSSL